MPMHPFDEMKQWVGFTARDTQRLQDAWQCVEPHVVPIIDHFYAKILASEGARAVLVDEAQVERLKVTLRQWLAELMTGPHDLDYYERRQRIGHRHVDVGLHSRYMFTAMSVIQEDLTRVLHDCDLSPDARNEAITSVQRVCALDLALMTGTYVESRERQQLATLQSMLVDNLTVTVLLVDPAGNIAAATRPSSRLFGGSATLGRPWREAVPSWVREPAELDRHVARSLQTGHDISLLRVDARDPVEQRDRAFRVHIVPLRHDQADFMLQVEDLTEAVALETRLGKAEALAQLGSMSAAVAHELRNPLAGISGAVQVIAGSLPEDAPYRPIMLKVHDEIHRLDRLVNDLLAFARPSRVKTERVALHRVASAVRDLVASDHPQASIVVDGQAEAQGDEAAVRGIVLNLVQNALQAAGDTARVRIELVDQHLHVDDDGPGIPDDVVDQIFEPFFTTKTRGTGLGLAISHQHAVAMAGSLTAGRSPSLGGARFTLTLPP